MANELLHHELGYEGDVHDPLHHLGTPGVVVLAADSDNKVAREIDALRKS